MPFRDFNAEEFLARNLTFIFHGVRYPSYAPDLTLGDLADACVYLGIAPDATERVQ